jgi:hypothetical protein
MVIVDKLKAINWKGLFSSKVFLVVLAAGLAFGVGRCTGPTKVVETTKTIETRHEVETVQQKLDLSEVMKAIQNLQVDTNKTRTIVKIVKPDGTQITTEKDTSDQKKQVTSQTETQVKKAETLNTQKVADTSIVQEKTRIVEKLKAPSWGLGVQAGTSLPGLFGGTAPKSYVPMPANLVLGAVVDHNLFWGLRGGVWLNTRLDAGLQLSWGF